MSVADKPSEYFILPGLPRAKILARYAAAPGKELASGKFGSVTSSAALAQPTLGRDGRPVAKEHHAAHRAEIAQFSDVTNGDEVAFLSLSYSDLLTSWRAAASQLAAHASALTAAFFVRLPVP